MSTYTFNLMMLSVATEEVEADSYEEAWEKTGFDDDGWSDVDFDLEESWFDSAWVDGKMIPGVGERDDLRNAIVAAAVQWFRSDDSAQEVALIEALEEYTAHQKGDNA